jgi:hypothetical protein
MFVLGFSGCSGYQQGDPLGLYIAWTDDACKLYFAVLTQ